MVYHLPEASLNSDLTYPNAPKVLESSTFDVLDLLIDELPMMAMSNRPAAIADISGPGAELWA